MCSPGSTASSRQSRSSQKPDIFDASSMKARQIMPFHVSSTVSKDAYMLRKVREGRRGRLFEKEWITRTWLRKRRPKHKRIKRVWEMNRRRIERRYDGERRKGGVESGNDHFQHFGYLRFLRLRHTTFHSPFHSI